MKILHIAPIGRHAEGIGSVLQKLVPMQISQGEDVKIVTPYDNRTYYDLPVTTIKDGKNFEVFIESWSPNIVIFHSVFNLKYYSFHRFLKKKNIPYLIQLHGALSVENYNKNKLKKKIALFLWIKGFVKHARTIIYLNNAEYNNSIVPIINPKFSIIPNGCEDQSDIRLKKKVENDLNILYIGRIAYVHKGLDILVEALRCLEKRHITGYNVTFYGNEDDIDVNRLKNDIENLEFVNYDGGVYGEKKDYVLRNADIFILTSRYEGMPMGVLESWSYGIPCILTSGTNMVNEKRDTNYYWYTELESSEIADTIVRAINQYKNDTLKYRTASIEQSKKFKWGSISRMSIDVYKNVLDIK